MAVTKRIRISVGETSYPIFYEQYQRRLRDTIIRNRKTVIISNPKVYALHGPSVIASVIPSYARPTALVIGDGERYKTQTTINWLYEQFHALDLTREDYIVALGGGVVGDTAGYAAATYKRGVHLIHAPTTVLSMVDSSIGGKVGINDRAGKNQIGTFYHPRAIIINRQWLGTLDRREIICGLAEILKAGILGARRALELAQEIDPKCPEGDFDKLTNLIHEAIAFKVGIVERDPFERGVRAILNFGHTFAHAIEAAERHRRPAHGLAVFAGMSGAIHFSFTQGYLTRLQANAILSVIAPYAGYLPRLEKEIDAYFEPMIADKKKRTRKLRFVLLRGVGQPVLLETESMARVRKAISFMREFTMGRHEI